MLIVLATLHRIAKANLWNKACIVKPNGTRFCHCGSALTRHSFSRDTWMTVMVTILVEWVVVHVVVEVVTGMG